MATSPEVVRAGLIAVTGAATLDLAEVVGSVALERRVDAAIAALPLLVPGYYDAAGALAAAWYDEVRDESQPASAYGAQVVGDPATDWIEREVAEFARALDEGDLEAETRRILDETTGLMQKEIARGFRDSITGNTRMDAEAIGWSRVARPGACKFCLMLAGEGSVYRSESTAIFASHKGCSCAARPEFRNGAHGPEASATQYLASSRRAKSDEAQAQLNARLRTYLNQHYPDAPG